MMTAPPERDSLEKVEAELESEMRREEAAWLRSLSAMFHGKAVQYNRRRWYDAASKAFTLGAKLRELAIDHEYAAGAYWAEPDYDVSG